MKRWVWTLVVLGVFLVVVLTFFRGIILSPGVILGGDWGLPVTTTQVDIALRYSLFTWTDQGTLFGTRQSVFTAIPFLVLLKLFSIVGLVTFFGKIFLVCLFLLAGISMYQLLVYFRVNRIAAIFGGLFYITTPIFFDYTIMGWIFVLFALGILPLAVKYFVISVNENGLKTAVIAGLLYAISVINSQSAVWFPLVFISLSLFLIRNKISLFNYIKVFGIVVGVFALLNAYWILNLIAYPDKAIMGSNIVNSSVSLGTSGHLSPFNIIRLFGGLFNYQYETAITTSWLAPLSLFGAILAVASLVFSRNRRLATTFWLIGLIPVVSLQLNSHRDWLSLIPFSNVFRDLARLTSLSSFAYAVLVALLCDGVYFLIKKRTELVAKIFILLLLGIWFLSSKPWWDAEISNWRVNIGCDLRLKTATFPSAYSRLEDLFSQQKFEAKAVYVPVKGIISIYDNEKLHGSCNELWDTFASYSPVPGALVITDRTRDYISDFVNALYLADTSDLPRLLSLTNVKYLVVRKDSFVDWGRDIMAGLDGYLRSGELDKYSEDHDIVVYSFRRGLPSIYAADNVYFEDGPVSSSSANLNNGNPSEWLPIVFGAGQVKSLNHLRSFNGYQQKPPLPALEHRRIDPTKFRVEIHNMEGPFLLLLSESFHGGWRAYPTKAPINFDKESSGKFISRNIGGAIQNDNLPTGSIWETWFRKPILPSMHFMANGYANGWIIDPSICKSATICTRNNDSSFDLGLVLEFYPQRFFYIGMFISAVSLFIVLIISFRKDKNNKVGIEDEVLNNRGYHDESANALNNVRGSYQILKSFWADFSPVKRYLVIGVMISALLLRSPSISGSGGYGLGFLAIFAMSFLAGLQKLIVAVRIFGGGYRKVIKPLIVVGVSFLIIFLIGAELQYELPVSPLLIVAVIYLGIVIFFAIEPAVSALIALVILFITAFTMMSNLKETNDFLVEMIYLFIAFSLGQRLIIVVQDIFTKNSPDNLEVVK